MGISKTDLASLFTLMDLLGHLRVAPLSCTESCALVYYFILLCLTPEDFSCKGTIFKGWCSNGLMMSQMDNLMYGYVSKY